MIQTDNKNGGRKQSDNNHLYPTGITHKKNLPTYINLLLT